MQINKKIITSAIVALLLLSTFAAAAPAFAAVDTFSATATVSQATVGQVVQINVIDASQGGQLVVTWQTVAGTMLGNDTTYAKPDGTATLFITMPNVAQGSYALIVKDVQYGATRSVPITIISSITLDPKAGLSGDSVVVTGTGFAATKKIAITFDGTTVTPSTAPTVSSTGDFTATIIVPTRADGSYVVTATDTATTPNVASANFLVGPSITLTPITGPAGTVVTITGKGFSQSVGAVTITVNGVTAPQVVAIKTTATGTFSGQFIVPTLPKNSGSSTYVVRAYDAGAVKEAFGTFKVTATTVFTVVPIATSPWQNTVVDITGSGFTAIAGTVVTFTFNGVTVGTLTTSSTGSITGGIPIPNLTAGYYNFVATDANGLTYTLSYQIGITLLVLSPTSGPTGTAVTYSAFGFHDGLTANITMGSITIVPTFTTVNVGGRLTGTFIIPTMPAGTYTVKITENDGLNAVTTFTVTAVSQVSASPSQGPAYSEVKLTATNFAASDTLFFYITNSTWGASIVMDPATGFSTTVTNSSGTYIGYFMVQGNWAVGTYTITVNNTANTLNATTVFTVGSAIFNVSTRATTYRQGDTMSFKVTSSYEDDVEIIIKDPEGYLGFSYVWVYIPMNSLYASEYGYIYYSQFTLPSDAPLGTWTWNATSMETGAVRTGSFTVIQSISSAVTDINTKLDAINSSIVTISGNVVTIKTGTASIQTTLTALNASIIAINGNVATLQTSMGTVTVSIGAVTSSVSQLSASISSISNGVASIQSTVGSFSTSLSNLNAAILSVNGSVATLSTSVGVVLTTLDDINAQDAVIDGNVATIQTSIGTLQGTVTSISNGVATIQTGVGTLQAEVSEAHTETEAIQSTTSGMSTLIYVAIVFAVIAAIAAVASILLMRKKIAS